MIHFTFRNTHETSASLTPFAAVFDKILNETHSLIPSTGCSLIQIAMVKWPPEAFRNASGGQPNAGRCGCSAS